MKRNSVLLALPLVALVMFVGCGGGSDDSSDNSSTDTTTQTEKPANTTKPASGGETIPLAADPSGALAYDTDTLDAKAGAVNVDFTNDAAIAHDVVFDDASGSEVARGNVITGESETVSFDAKPGKYTYYCSLPGHEAAGMKGTLTVK